MKKLLFLLMMTAFAAAAQLPDPDYIQRKQIGFNWLFDEDTVLINRLHVGDGKFGIDSLGKIIYYNNAAISAGDILRGAAGGGSYTRLAAGSPLQVLRVNAGGTDLEWSTPTTGTVTSIATTSPITGGPITGTGTIAINNADADGSTKGAASFTANDFDAASGNISIDYANGQAATSGQDGFLQSADWSTFNKKTGLVQAPTELTGQTGSIAATTAYTTPAADGWYRISVTGTITTSAGTSLDLAIQLRYTEATDNVAKTFPTTNVNGYNRTQTNTTGASVAISSVCHVKASTAIQYITAFSFSGGAPQYNLHVTIEQLDF